jgi:superfamily II DNA or RNA helicase
MASISFIDFVFPQFAPATWQGGVSVFHAGGLQVFGELVSARVKTGIGENYEVRMKLHSHGKCVQWMECTCQAYRRRNEKCVHLAAFCIYLDQDRPEVLARNGLGTGGSDRHMRTAVPLAEGASVANMTQGMPVSSFGVAAGPGVQKPDALSRLENTSIETLITSRVASVKGVTLSEADGTLKVVVLGDSGKRLAYQLRADDALRILRNPAFEEILSPKLREAHANTSLTAHRFFDVEKFGKGGVRIFRSVALREESGKETKVFALEDVPEVFVGREALFVKRMGFVPFGDALSASQLYRWEEYPRTATLDGDTAAALFQSGFQRLRETAEVRLADDLAKLRVVTELEIPELKLKAAGDGHFYVEPLFQGFTLGEGRVLDTVEGGPQGANSIATTSVLYSILRARQEGRQYVQTKQGWVKIGESLDWLQSRLTSDGKLRLSALELIKFREQLASDADLTGQGDIVARIRAGLVSSATLKLPDLTHTKLTLRPYQEEGVKWLWWLFNNNLGGLLADEMGLGKTHQAMGLIAAIAKNVHGKMSLVVCPTSVLDHWIDKLRTFVPNLNAICYHGTQRRPDLLRPGKEHLVIVTSYGVLLRDIQTLMGLPWGVVILDEAHLVKNQTTRTYRAACRLRSDMRLCLTGTPLENDLMELKNLFDFIAPTYLGSDAEFKRKHIAPAIKDPLAEIELQRLIHPFKLRRHKRDVLTELPEKVEDIRHCHLNREQYDLYTEALALRGRALVETLVSENNPVPYVHVFSVISLLKQICDDPALVDSRYDAVGSGKLSLFDELLAEALDAGHKVVVFSQYAKMIARLAKRLAAQGVRYVTLTGSTTNRGAVVREFQENAEVQVFLGSLLAGGTGIDLTAGSVVIHFDRWWNAAKENQATDRIHRIGQNRNVQVYKLITKGTLEERIDEIINRKRVLFDRFVEQDNEMFKHLSREDLLELLAPPETYQGIDAVERESLALAVGDAISIENI